MSLTGYSYPWDHLGDDAAFDRVASLNLDVVALAATYHATRLATPLHPTRRVTELDHSAAYFPLRGEAWTSRRLRPRAPDEWIGPHAFVDAVTQLVERGIEVDGWIVLTHVDDLETTNSDLAVRNAFGEIYSYALCPSHVEVREYCRTLVTETLRSAPLRGVVLEACGPMGLEHSSAHDKIDVAQWGPLERQLLSLCFCHACEVAMRNVGLESAELARVVREGLDRDAATMDDALGEMHDAVEAFRLSRSTTLQFDVTDAARRVNAEASVTLHASAQPWATGSFAASSSDALAPVNCAVANCWDESRAAIELSGVGPMTRSLGAYLRIDHDWSQSEQTLSRYASMGVKELHLYHLGLLSAASAANAGRLATTWRRRCDVGLDQIEESLSDE
ncbi:MAG: hypothetical protein WA359_04625 [Acidimicrobiales bacterium]